MFFHLGELDLKKIYPIIKINCTGKLKSRSTHLIGYRKKTDRKRERTEEKTERKKCAFRSIKLQTNNKRNEKNLKLTTLTFHNLTVNLKCVANEQTH